MLSPPYMWYVDTTLVIFFMQYLVTHLSRQYRLYNVNKFGTTLHLSLQPKLSPLSSLTLPTLAHNPWHTHQLQMHGCYLTMICRSDISVVTWPSFVSRITTSQSRMTPMLVTWEFNALSNQFGHDNMLIVKHSNFMLHFCERFSEIKLSPVCKMTRMHVCQLSGSKKSLIFTFISIPRFWRV